MQKFNAQKTRKYQVYIGCFFCSFVPYLLEWGLEFLLYLLAFMSNFLKTLTIPKGRRPTQPWLSVEDFFHCGFFGHFSILHNY
jgi:hypothetical protein